VASSDSGRRTVTVRFAEIEASTRPELTSPRGQPELATIAIRSVPGRPVSHSDASLGSRFNQARSIPENG
jgi:hypothetical protein